MSEYVQDSNLIVSTGPTPDALKELVLRLLVNADGTGENLVLRLFSNEHSLHSKDLSDTFEEPIGGGYEPVILQGGDWQVSSEKAAHAGYTFAFQGAVGLVRGWFLTRGTDLVERGLFPDGPYEVLRRGDKVKVSPVELVYPTR